MDSRYKRTHQLSGDGNSLQPPPERAARSRSPMTSPPPNSVTEHGTSEVESVLSGATSGLHLDAATQELGEAATQQLGEAAAQQLGEAAAQQLGEAAAQQLGEAATQELGGEGFVVLLSLEMDVLYDPPGGTRVTEAYAKTEYDFLSQALSMIWILLIILVLLLFTDWGLHPKGHGFIRNQSRIGLNTSFPLIWTTKLE